MNNTAYRDYKKHMEAFIVVILISCFLVYGKQHSLKLQIVASDSMAPSIHAGDLILTVATPFEHLSTGNIITYYLPEQSIYITHRVVEIDRKKKRVITKGDANEIEDHLTIGEANIVGVVKYKIPFIGKWILYLQNPVIVLVIFGLTGCICFLTGHNEMQKHKQT